MAALIVLFEQMEHIYISKWIRLYNGMGNWAMEQTEELHFHY